jgi:hypothetical protein
VSTGDRSGRRASPGTDVEDDSIGVEPPQSDRDTTRVALERHARRGLDEDDEAIGCLTRNGPVPAPRPNEVPSGRRRRGTPLEVEPGGPRSISSVVRHVRHVRLAGHCHCARFLAHADTWGGREEAGRGGIGPGGAWRSPPGPRPDATASTPLRHNGSTPRRGGPVTTMRTPRSRQARWSQSSRPTVSDDRRRGRPRSTTSADGPCCSSSRTRARCRAAARASHSPRSARRASRSTASWLGDGGGGPERSDMVHHASRGAWHRSVRRVAVV